MGVDCVHLRMPGILPVSAENQYIEACKKWTLDQLARSPKYRWRFAEREISHGDQFSVWDTSHRLLIQEKDRKTIGGKWEGDDIALFVPATQHLETKKLLAVIYKLLDKRYTDFVARRVDDLNDRFFHVEISGIHLRQSTSNWGSCSPDGKVRLSSRLLFAPIEVLDYVIIHELAHRKEMNHSPKFWNWVAKADPGYKKKEKWLKDWGYTCDVKYQVDRSISRLVD